MALPVPASRPAMRWLSSEALALYALLGAFAVFVGLGRAPLQRTQEARVLETARQMLGQGPRGWLVPELNGKPRLRKPPLAYWLAAAGFTAGGVSEAAGRAPSALLGWATLLVTFSCGRWLFGARAGFFASACLLCSYLFFRYVRLAETDTPAMLFVTLGIYALWRGARIVEEAQESERIEASGRTGLWERSGVWFHVGAASVALAILAKGPPGVYPPLFLLAWCALRRRWAGLRRFVTCGAPLTLMLVALPWFIYVFHTVGLEQWKNESDELLTGEDHSGHFYQYFYEILKAAAPWCFVAVGAIVAAVRRRQDDRILGLLIWLVVIFFPLCLIGNKQFHYLMPLMPPLMLLVGWWLDEAVRRAQAGPSRRISWLIDATFLISALAVPAILVAPRTMGMHAGTLERALAGGVALAMLVVAGVYVRRGQASAVFAYLVALAILFVPAVGFWMPRLEGGESQEIARQVAARYGAGPYCFYGRNYSLLLCWNMRRPIPQELTPEGLARRQAAEPRLVTITKRTPKISPPPLPAGYRQVWEVRKGSQLMQVYRYEP